MEPTRGHQGPRRRPAGRGRRRHGTGGRAHPPVTTGTAPAGRPGALRDRAPRPDVGSRSVAGRTDARSEIDMAQEQTTRQGGGDDDDAADVAVRAGQERREKLAAETDDILDEIDDVLEIQRGGLRAVLRAEGRPVTPPTASADWPASAVPAAYLRPGTGSFTDFLAGRRTAPAARAPGRRRRRRGHCRTRTTIVAVTCADGVVIAGDRRATMGNLIAQRDIEKVFVADTPLGHRHRRHGRGGGRDGAAVPARAGALREDRGRPALVGRQGEPAGHDDPRQPRRGHAGPGRRAAVRRRTTHRVAGRRLPASTRRGGSFPTTSPAAGTRSTTTTPSVPARCSPDRAEEAVRPIGADRRPRCARPSRRSTTRPTTTAPPAGPT